jgi:hypothetical protein
MKKIIIIADRQLKTAPRVIREINALKNNYDIVTIGGGNNLENTIPNTEISRFDVSFFDKILRKIFFYTKSPYYYKHVFTSAVKKFGAFFKNHQPSCVIVHEPKYLPILYAVKKSYGIDFSVVFNAHEYHPLEFETQEFVKKYKPAILYFYKEYVTKVDLLVNVCEQIRVQCLKDFNKDSIVIPNAASWHNNKPTKTGSKINIIHHGGAMAVRKIEVMIEMMAYLPEHYTLTLMLTDDGNGYLNELKKIAEPYKSIFFLAPVAFKKIVPTLLSYDIGLFILAPTSFNYEVALPNKLYEFVQARLCLAVSPNIEMKNLVEANDLGIVAKDYTAKAMATAILELTPTEIDKYKMNSDACAKKLSAEHYDAIYLEAINNLST